MTIHFEIMEKFDQPASKIFAVLTDVKRHPEWMDEIDSITRLPATPLAVGANYDQGAKFNGRTVTIRMEVIDFQPNRLLKLESTGTMPTVTTWWLEPDKDGTRVYLNFNGEPGELYDMIAQGMAAGIQRSAEKQLHNLKALVDHEA